MHFILSISDRWLVEIEGFSVFGRAFGWELWWNMRDWPVVSRLPGRSDSVEVSAEA